MNVMEKLMALMPGHVSCEEFDERLDDFIDGDMSFGGRMRMSMHKVICAACAAYAAAYAKTVGAVKASFEEDKNQSTDETVPEGLVQDILNHRAEGSGS